MDDRYEIVDMHVGGGGFGRVDKAKDKDLDRFVAIKTLDPLFKIAPSLEDKERFRREAKTLARLSHPNIPAIYDVRFNEEENKFCLLVEWIEGMTVNAALQQRGVMSLEEVRRWFGNVCSALSHAHEEGIIHRDVKPSNMIITQDMMSCYLVDFGISITKAELVRLTNGTPIGTPGYMSPEQESGEELFPASDVFSLGVVLYECLCGIRPGVGDYKPLNQINEAIPPTIDELVRACLLDKNARVQSAADFHDRLARALRPSSNFQTVLSQGALHEIQTALSQLDSYNYINLPAGQRRLLTSRIKDLVRVDEPKLRNAVASLLAELIRIGYRGRDSDYESLVAKGLIYGYKKKYSESWTGNIQIREVFNDVAKECHDIAHKTLTKATLEFVGSEQEIDNEESWFYHDMRILLQNLLANGHCDDDSADCLGDKLDEVNEISHSPARPI